MAVVALSKTLVILIILYVLALVFSILAAIPMILHVYPRSECLLFSSQEGSKLFYGHYATCNIVGYVYLIIILGALYLIYKCRLELVHLKGHHPHGPYVSERVPSHIMWVHIIVSSICFLLTMITTIGYVTACNNLHAGVRSNVQTKLNANPFDTRGEEIHTRYEDDYKFHRYTNRYGNAFGSEFYTIRITCRSILTDPEIYQRLHDTHYEQQSRYYGYWYGTDLYAYDSQYEANRTNALIEACMAGCWLCFIFWLGGIILIVTQKYYIKKQQEEQDRMSMHSAMMGEGSIIGSQFRKDGSIISGRASTFQRGGSLRGSDRSIKSTKRDIDDLALSTILQTPTSQPRNPQNRTGYDDMMINNFISRSNPHVGAGLSHHSSRETGYISDGSTGFQQAPPAQRAYQSNSQPYLNGNSGFTRHYPGNSVPVRTTAEATYLSRDEVETEIF